MNAHKEQMLHRLTIRLLADSFFLILDCGALSLTRSPSFASSNTSHKSFIDYVESYIQQSRDSLKFVIDKHTCMFDIAQIPSARSHADTVRLCMELTCTI